MLLVVGVLVFALAVFLGSALWTNSGRFKSENAKEAD